MIGAEEVFCGIDIGTTHVKAVVISRSGVAARVARTRTPVINDGYGDCHDPQQIYNTVCQVVREALDGFRRAPTIVGIGVTSVGEEGVPLGPEGEVLYPAIAWYERRRSPAVDEWSARHGPEEFFQVTGLHWELGFTLSKWLWLRSFRAEEWSRCRHWLGLADYVAWRLTGEAGMSVSHASRTGALDLRTRRWREDWAAEGLTRGTEALPPLLPAGETVGTVTPDALPGVQVQPDTPVVLTGLDHAVGGFAAGLRDSSEVLDSMGTAEALIQPRVGDFMPVCGGDVEFDFNVSLDGESVIAVVGLGSGASADALGRTLRAGRGWTMNELERVAREAGPGAGGLFYVPARTRVNEGGAFVGYDGSQGPGEFYRALLEGWSFAAARLVDALRGASGAHRVVCIGGGTESRLWLEIKASVLGVPLRVVRTPELVARGAALLAAGCVLGPDAAEQWSVSGEEVAPIPEWVDRYRDVAEHHRATVAALQR